MPTLNWIGKEKVVSHHQDVPYRVLEHKYGFTADKGEQTEPTNSGNKIIQGDNLEALKSLLPEYEGKIKCIYIDPPYNAGKEACFLEKKDETAYYFIYEKDSLTSLDYDSLELIKTKGEQYVIYADNCLLPKEFMAKKNIIFKKIPRDITKF
jgi:hypothetical protein